MRCRPTSGLKSLAEATASGPCRGKRRPPRARLKARQKSISSPPDPEDRGHRRRAGASLREARDEELRRPGEVDQEAEVREERRDREHTDDLGAEQLRKRAKWASRGGADPSSKNSQKDQEEHD